MNRSAPRRPRRLLRWIAFSAYALLLLSLSSIPGPNLPQEVGRINDKLLHGIAYSGAGVLARLATGSTPAATAAVAVLGAVDENYQRLIPGRTPDPRDWMADLIGGFVGAVLAAVAERVRNPARLPRSDPSAPASRSQRDGVGEER